MTADFTFNLEIEQPKNITCDLLEIESEAVSESTASYNFTGEIEEKSSEKVWQVSNEKLRIDSSTRISATGELEIKFNKKISIPTSYLH